jgi:uncharacterized membrane protein YqjE
MTSNGHESGTLREQMSRGRDEARGLGAEIGEIVEDIRELGRLEMELARADIAEQIALLRGIAMWGAVTLIFALMLVAFALVTVMFALALVVETWLAALITTAIALLVTAIAGYMAYRRAQTLTIVPQRSIDSVKRDVEWTREQITSRAR